jgi:outer membrane protein TolC
VRPVFVVLTIAFLATVVPRVSAQTVTAQSQVPPPFLGGVPNGMATAEPLALSIVEAIGRALRYNLGMINAQRAMERAASTREKELADLLPNVSARLAETRQKVNLAAFGFPLPAGIPGVVGPFNVFDARVYVSQAIVDFKAVNDLRAETHNRAAAEFSYKSARDLVVLVSGNAYMQTLAASARAETAQAQLQTADALYRQAVDLKAGGLVAGIDVVRAEVQLATERQRVTASKNAFEKSKLQLARIIGMPIGQEFTLSDKLPDLPVPDMTLDEALERAYKTRPDYQAALERVSAAEDTRRAISGESLPAFRVNADFGGIGLTPGDARGTFAVAAAVTVPVYQGGRNRARVAEADLDLKARQSEAEDLRAGIYYEVRSAFLDLRASDEQLQVATRARALAADQLAQARDRFSAGLADNIEVIQAQEAVTLAAEQYINALYGNSIAKALLARGLGIAEDAARLVFGKIP